MPMSFHKFFKKCCVIIDCTEVERPTDLLARAQVWSNYKHHSTIKFLIGITPQGSISFISSCVGGRMSDKILQKLLDYCNIYYQVTFQLKQDQLIFLIQGTSQQLTVGSLVMIMPGCHGRDQDSPFTKRKKQLEKVNVNWSRELSIVRIHVERVIGVLKQKFTILQGCCLFH